MFVIWFILSLHIFLYTFYLILIHFQKPNCPVGVPSFLKVWIINRRSSFSNPTPFLSLFDSFIVFSVPSFIVVGYARPAPVHHPPELGVGDFNSYDIDASYLQGFDTNISTHTRLALNSYRHTPNSITYLSPLTLTLQIDFSISLGFVFNPLQHILNLPAQYRVLYYKTQHLKI